MSVKLTASQPARTEQNRTEQHSTMDNLQLDMWLPLGPDGVTVQTTSATLHKSQVPASEC